MDQLDDAALFAKIQQGSSEAFETLYDRYRTLVYTFALRACSDAELASEVTQDVFVRLWTTSAEYRSERSSFRTWLLTITRRIVYDKVRRLQRHHVMMLGVDGNVAQDPERPPVLSPEAITISQWFRDDVAVALQSLHAEERTVIELAYFRQLTLSEIAEHLNRPIGTVKTRLHKALKALRETMPEWKGGFER